MLRKNIKKLLVFVFVLLVFLNCKLDFIHASATSGSIDSVFRYAKGVDLNNVKINFGLFKGSINVVVKDNRITGFAWGEGIGWVNLSPENGGVLNNGEGTLLGFATSESGGWINFKPDNGGVTINSSGEFMGYALTEKMGRISFNCINDNSCATDNFKVKTDWRPISIRNDGTQALPPVVTPTVPPVVQPLTDAQKIPEIIVEKNGTTRLKPLPIVDLGQYESGGDVVKYNGKTTTELGGIKYTMPTEDVPIVKNKVEEKIPVENPPSGNIVSNITQKTKEISSFVQEKSIEIKKEAEVVSDSTAVNISTKTVTTVGVAGGSTAVFSSFAGSALTISDLLMNFLRIWSLFLSAIGLRKKVKPWGVVYDSVTKQPLDPAYVVLQDKNNKEVATAITDLDGRFGFLVPEGVYKIYVKKNNYIFPSRKLFGMKSDELYENLYFGEYLDFYNGKLIIKDIPMDPVKFDWNEFTKKDKNLLKFNSPYAHLYSKISNILFYLGFILAILLVVINRFSYYNIAIIILYIILFTLRRNGMKPKSYGTISERVNGFPLSFAVVRVFSKGSQKEIFHRVANKYGHYYCLLPKGEYYITIEKKNKDESYSNIYTSENFLITKGILNKNFKV